MENIEFTPEEFKMYLQATNYNFDGLRNIKKFKGKHFIINGSLDLGGLPINGKLYDMTIDGNLDISNTNISRLENISSKYNKYWNTPYEQHLVFLKKQRDLEYANQMRQENLWNVNDTNLEGEMANAVFKFAVSEGDLNEFSSEDIERLKELRSRIDSLEYERNNLSPDDENWDEKDTELMDLIYELETEIEELEEDKTDVYDLKSEGSHFFLDTFRSLTNDYLYAVGDEDMVKKSIDSFFEEMIDQPEHYFANNFLEDFIDGDEVANNFEESEREYILENPEYFDIEKELSDEQQEEIWLLEMEKNVYERFGVRSPIHEPTEEYGFTVFDFMDSEDNRFQYKNENNEWFLYMNGKRVQPFQFYEDEDTEEHDNDRERRISDIDYEIEEIKDNPDGELNEESVEDALEDRLDYIRNSPVDFLQNYGFSGNDYLQYIDRDSLRDHLISSADAGELNSYDGTYDEININDTWFTVMRID